MNDLIIGPIAHRQECAGWRRFTTLLSSGVLSDDVVAAATTAAGAVANQIISYWCEAVPPLVQLTS